MHLKKQRKKTNNNIDNNNNDNISNSNDNNMILIRKHNNQSIHNQPRQCHIIANTNYAATYSRCETLLYVI